MTLTDICHNADVRFCHFTGDPMHLAKTRKFPSQQQLLHALCGYAELSTDQSDFIIKVSFCLPGHYISVPKQQKSSLLFVSSNTSVIPIIFDCKRGAIKFCNILFNACSLDATRMYGACPDFSNGFLRQNCQRAFSNTSGIKR